MFFQLLKISIIIALFTATTFAQSSQMPDWLREHMDYMTQGSAMWVTSNDEYKSENEPFEAYATEWKYGVGKQSLIGRLYGIRDGKPTNDFWEYHVFWHPAEKKVYFYQVGAGGAVGMGEMKDNSGGKRTGRRTEMVLHFPNGNSITDRHEIFEDKGEHSTSSYTLAEMHWKPGRTYVWKLKEE
ncbi:MAG: hypothetical protein DWQ47_11140 [Acidobacteria bacterium]|nr:MAG: hypothetical protein DWQ32_13555 [Acidobacteriota bacterium]REJ98134.1 MAG: hypothetical protein DWQ38_16355 [Acidobacteriota bacterium]REK16877.1 MAG: hypothetical protein DWQ43_01400 [Acidobacteriota bacterium]REK42788.1 MAG: hypothetical protein DWQ47_11140 [Acidobacteriota bacterium]